MDKLKEYSSSSKLKDRCMINCSSLSAPKCVKRMEALVQGVKENLKRNKGKYICRACSTFLKSEINIKIQEEEKKEYIDSTLKDILSDRETRPLSGKVKKCLNKTHEISTKYCIPKYPYNRDEVPVEDFYNKNNPEKIYKLCLGCRIYRSQCLTVTNSKRKKDSFISGHKTCLSNCHSVATNIPRENIPIKYFLENIEDPDSKICLKCHDCRKHIKNIEEKRTSIIQKNGGIFCIDCKVEKRIEEMAINKDGTSTKCKNCKQCDINYSLKRCCNLMKHFRKLQYERMIEKECSCEICKCIYIKPNEGDFICKKLYTRIENGNNIVDYENKTYLVKDFLIEYKDLLEFRVLDFDHLPSEDLTMIKKASVSSIKPIGDMTKESLKCQLIDCECHIKETIKRERGSEHYGEMLKRIRIVNNIKKSGCVFCNYKAENDDMLRFIHFDHIDPNTKTSNISSMISDNSFTLEDMHNEISKCRVLCAFCHRILTNYFYGSSYIENHTSIIPGPIEYIFDF